MGSNVLWAVVFGFLLGVFFRSFVPVGLAFAGFLFVLGVVPPAFIFFERSRARVLVIVAVALFSCALGIARMHIASVSGDPRLTALVGRDVTLEGVVSQEPDAREGSTLVSIRATDIVASSTTPVQAGVLAILPAHAQVKYGDRVYVSGTLQLPQAFDTGSGRQFAYPEFLAAQGIEYQLGFARVSATHENVGDPFNAFAINMKELYLRGLNAVLPDPEGALAGGITVGDKRSVGQEISSDFQRDSLVHMLVLSGYNITVVLNTITRVLVRTPRALQFGGNIGVVVFFILMSGGASSATRAGLMALIAVFARATHRIYLGERALAVVSLGMIAWNPWTLCFDPGFQLSALATLGLILFTPFFAAHLSRVPETFGAREILSSTCATQLAVLPLLLYQNGSLSLVALPANVFALVPVPLAMLLSFIAALGGMFFGSLAVPVALPAYAILSYIIAVAHLFAALPFASVSVPAFSAWWLFLIYGTLFAAIFYTKSFPQKIPEV